MFAVIIACAMRYKAHKNAPIGSVIPPYSFQIIMNFIVVHVWTRTCVGVFVSCELCSKIQPVYSTHGFKTNLSNSESQ